MLTNHGYTIRTFEELQEERFLNGADYYICIVKQKGYTYLFDASSFLEHYMYKKESTENPLTKQLIDDFEVQVSSKEKPYFKLYMKKTELLTPPNYFPVFWSDTSRPEKDRIVFMIKHAKFLKDKKLSEAISLYEKAAQLGSSLATLYLGEIYLEQLNQKNLGFHYLQQAVESKTIVIQNIFFCAHIFKKNKKYDLAFRAYEVAAHQNSPYAIGEVIQRLELGAGVEKNEEKAREWRQKLPEKWKSSSISDFFSHLKEIKYPSSNTGYPN